MKRTTTISRSALARTVVVARLRKFSRSYLFIFMGLLAFLMPATPLAAQANIGVVIADFNHDGIPDVLTASTQSSFILSFGSVPYGTFNPVARNVPYPAGCVNFVNNSVVVGDFNGDGFPDIVLECLGGQQSPALFIMLNNGDGTFTNGTSLQAESKFLVGDFNHDGILDIVTEGGAADGPQTLLFYAGKGDGTFAAAVTSNLTGQFLGAPLAADINQDGYPDLVLGVFSNATVNIFGNNRDGTFGVLSSGVYGPNFSITVGPPTSVTATDIFTGNFFGTGLPDLAVVNSGATPGIYILQNTSTSSSYSFGTPAQVLSPGLIGAKAASFTSTLSDLLVNNGTTLSVLANGGNGNFAASYSGLSVADTASTLFAAADANGDGHADIYTVATTATGANITVNLVSGTASASTAPFVLGAGTVPVSAAWPGNVNFAGSTASGSQIVNAISTAVALGSSENPSLVGDTVTFAATVSPPNFGNYIPTGTVTFMDGTTSLGTSPLAQGVATLAVSTLTAGSHSISAVYSGDSIFGASSQTLTQQVTGLTLTSITPNTAQIGAPNQTITVAGSGFVASTVVQLNGANLVTTLVNSTTLTAVIPSANFAQPATFQITLKDSVTGSMSTSLPFTVLAPAINGTFTGPPSALPGAQPSLNFTIPPYPVDLVATFTLTAKSGIASGVTDPNVLFANGSTTFSVVIKAGATTFPTIQLQAGTIAETITIPLVLTANNVVVTTNLAPVVIVVAPAVPTATATILARSGTQLTVTIDGFSNTREIVQANFHFVPVAGASLSMTDFTAPVAGVFATYFATPASLSAGSSFVYTQQFSVGDASKIESVQVTLTNSIGVSVAQTAQ